jgi:predicted secreted acid phosphatase
MKKTITIITTIIVIVTAIAAMVTNFKTINAAVKNHAATCAMLKSEVGIQACENAYKSALAETLKQIQLVKNPIVTLDLDETVQTSAAAQLDNEIYGYNPDRYAQHIAGGFETIPGAKDYILAVKKAGAKVVFVTARLPEEAGISASGLNKLGIPCEESDVICTSSGRHKARVFAKLSKTHTIVAQAGDVQTDFAKSNDTIKVFIPNVWPYGKKPVSLVLNRHKAVVKTTLVDY